MRVAGRHIEAGGVGYKRGYTTVEAFLATDPNDWSYMPFLDIRGHVFNDGKFSANVGMGTRTLWGNRAYGINAYYDYRNGKHKGYSQVSAGIETLGKLWDLRFNGYFPVGGKVSYAYQRSFAGFVGNSILVSRKFEYSMSGVDGEIGFHFGKTSNFDFYAAAGSYYFTRSGMGKSAIGAKARVAAYYKEYVTLEVSNTYDAVFHDNVQGQLTLSLPFGPKTRSKYKDCHSSCNKSSMILASRMVQPVVKQEIVVLNTHKTKTAASNFIIFVNNESSSNGTIESPYPTLLLAQENSKPGDIIYVFTGDGTTKGMNEGIILQDNQKFWGSSIGHSASTNLGTVYIPPYTLLPPKITNLAGSGVTLASNNEVSGFAIANAFVSGVTGINPGNFSISSCVLAYTSGAGSGLDLSFTDGSHNITMESVLVFHNTNIGMNFIANTNSPTVNITADHIAFMQNGTPLNVRADDFATVNSNFNTNFFLDNTSPITFRSAGNATTASNFSLVRGFIFATTDSPIDILASGTAPVQVTILANSMTNCNKAASIGFNNPSSILEFSENQISGTAVDRGLTLNYSNAVNNAVATISNNAFLGNAAAGCALNTSATNLAATINANTFAGNVGNGFTLTNNAGAAVVTLDSNSFSANGSGTGFSATANGGSLCLNMVANASSDATAYNLTNPGGTFNLTPCNVDSVNAGTITRSGVTLVESCSSGIPCPP